ncbi:MAG: mobilization protein, partial [Lachnospiraceae bacterium]|nr:mobilization protein [Lachnospiraceae bacterium]
MERGADIEAGNSFRGLLTALGELLNSFKEIIMDGLCWFPRLMRWQTSKGEVSPVFEDNRNEGYYYQLKSYMDIHTSHAVTRQEY